MHTESHKAVYIPFANYLICPFLHLDPDIWSSGGAVGLFACQRGRVRAFSSLYSWFVRGQRSVLLPVSLVFWQNISKSSQWIFIK